MPKIITEQNLRLLVDTLLQEGNRVVGPKAAGEMSLYEPLGLGDELVLGVLPRRSAKETFFPLCEDILSYEKKEGKMNGDGCRLLPPPRNRPGRGALPVTPLLPASWMRFFPGTTTMNSFWSGGRRRPSSASPAPGVTTPASAPRLGCRPAEHRGSDIFLTPLKDGSLRLGGGPDGEG